MGTCVQEAARQADELIAAADPAAAALTGAQANQAVAKAHAVGPFGVDVRAHVFQVRQHGGQGQGLITPERPEVQFVRIATEEFTSIGSRAFNFEKFSKYNKVLE